MSSNLRSLAIITEIFKGLILKCLSMASHGLLAKNTRKEKMITVSSDLINIYIQLFKESIICKQTMLYHIRVVVYFEIALPNVNNIHLSHSRSVGDKSESAVRTSWAKIKLPLKTKHSFTA